ncbi:MAG: ABC transporter ATP-binding protein/permease [Firmicutes bacterium]|nr:ABC transporter ATP-binding protein/permease [Bacillota bacterium]
MLFFKRYKNLRQLKPYFSKYTALTIVLIFVMVTASTMGMVTAYLLSEQLLSITNLAIDSIVKFTILLMAAVLIHHIFWFLWSLLGSVLSNRVAKDIRRDIAVKTLSAKYQTVKENMSGYYLERLNDDAFEVSNFLPYVAGTLVDVFTNCSFLALIYFLNWQCGLFFTIGVLLLFVIDIIRVKKDLAHLKSVKNTTEQMNSKFNELIRGIKDIKGFGIGGETLSANRKIHFRVERQNISRVKTSELLRTIRSFLQWTIDACLVFMCAFWLFPNEQIAVVVLLIIFNYKGFMYETVGWLAKVKSYYVQGDYQAGRILEITQKLSAEKFGENAVSVSSCSIEVKNISHSYEKFKPVLNNVSFTVQKCSLSIFLGASGSGKSTLFSLVTKLLTVPDGTVFFDGLDINSFDEYSFRSAVCIVNQEPFIFCDTVLNNVKIVRPEAVYEDIVAACKAANIHNEISKLPYGYQTPLSENGTNLSVGQKQRLSIARAVLKDTPIILFDEPTSALDKENQSMFLDCITELKKSKTVLVIAHKLTSYEMFDNVFTLKNGRLKESSKGNF